MVLFPCRSGRWHDNLKSTVRYAVEWDRKVPQTIVVILLDSVNLLGLRD